MFTLSLALQAPNVPASFLLNALVSSQLDTSHIDSSCYLLSPWAQGSILPASFPTARALPVPSPAILAPSQVGSRLLAHALHVPYSLLEYLYRNKLFTLCLLQESRSSLKRDTKSVLLTAVAHRSLVHILNMCGLSTAWQEQQSLRIPPRNVEVSCLLRNPGLGLPPTEQPCVYWAGHPTFLGCKMGLTTPSPLSCSSRHRAQHTEGSRGDALSAARSVGPGGRAGGRALPVPPSPSHSPAGVCFTLPRVGAGPNQWSQF